MGCAVCKTRLQGWALVVGDFLEIEGGRPGESLIMREACRAWCLLYHCQVQYIHLSGTEYSVLQQDSTD